MRRALAVSEPADPDVEQEVIERRRAILTEQARDRRQRMVGDPDRDPLVDPEPGTENARPVSNTEQNRKNRTTTYEINRTTSNTTRNPGTVKNLTAAVFIAPRAVAPTVDAKGVAVPATEPQKRTAEA